VWDASSITYYLDGSPYHTVAAAAVLLPTQPMHVIFDQVGAQRRARAHHVTRVLQAVDPLLFPPHADAHAAYEGEGVSMRVAWVRAYAPQ